MVYIINPNIQEAEAGESLTLGPVSSEQWVPGHSGLYKDSLFWEKKRKKKHIEILPKNE